MLEEVKKENEFCNIDVFHDHGITGEGIVIWNTEEGNEHCEITNLRLKTVAPGATILNAGIYIRIKNNEIVESHVNYKGKRYSVEGFVKEKKVKIISRSKEGRLTSMDCLFAFYQNLQKKYNLIIFNCAGNDGHDSERYNDEVAILVGACFERNGQIHRCSYSSVSGGVDFVDFVGVWSGTSFATPYLAGKAALLLELYGDMPQAQMYDLLKTLTNFSEWNKELGWGIPILPKLEKKGEIEMDFENLPIDGELRITSGYGYRNTGIKGASSFHRGVDIGADKSKKETKIVSVAAGTVAKNFWHDTSGWVIMIKHSGRWTTRYQHMKYKSPLSVGTPVSAGQVIGVMGNTSKTIKNMGVHLHMELHDNGVPVNFIDKLYNIKKGGDDMTRDETAALIREMIAIERTKDEPAANWAASEIAEAKKLGITDGKRPTAPVTRQEVAVMIMRVYRLIKKLIKK